MKDLFLCLLVNISKFGKLTGANFFNEGYSTVTIENDDSEYTISIMRKNKGEKEDAQ